MKRYIIGICLALIPAITLLAQEEGITFLKDGKLEVNTVFNPDSLKQDTLPNFPNVSYADCMWRNEISITTSWVVRVTLLILVF